MTGEARQFSPTRTSTQGEKSPYKSNVKVGFGGICASNGF